MQIYRFHVKEAFCLPNILTPKTCHKERQVDPRLGAKFMGRVYESLNRDFRNRSVVYIGVRGCKRAFTTRKYSKRGSIYARSAPSIKRRETIWNGGVSRSQGKGRRLHIEGGGNREGLKKRNRKRGHFDESGAISRSYRCIRGQDNN